MITVTEDQTAVERFLIKRGWVVTSRYRPTGTHQFGAVDLAPRYHSGSLAATGVHGYAHQFALRDAAAAQAYGGPSIQVFLEHDHIHLQDQRVLPEQYGQQEPGVEIANPEAPSLRFTPWRYFIDNTNQPMKGIIMNTNEYGDIEEGDDEIGDLLLDQAGDVELGDEFGDEFGDEIGDEDGDIEEGGPRLRKIGKWMKRHKKGLLIGTGVGAVGLGALALARRRRRIRAKKVELAKRAALSRPTQSARLVARANSASDPANTWPFFLGDNMRFVTSPVSEAVNRMTRTQVLNLLNRAAGDTPTPPIYKAASASAGTATITISTADLPTIGSGVSPIDRYFFPFILVELAASVLNALPTSLITTTELLVPTDYLGIQNLLMQGALVVQPADTTKRLAFGLVPFVTLNSAPQPVLGQISSGKPLTITMSGLADGTVMNVILGGTTHPSVGMMRHWAENGVLPTPPHKQILSSSFLSTF